MKTPLEELFNEFGKHYLVISNRRIYYLLCNSISMIFTYTNNYYNNCKINMKNISNNTIANLTPTKCFKTKDRISLQDKKELLIKLNANLT